MLSKIALKFLCLLWLFFLITTLSLYLCFSDSENKGDFKELFSLKIPKSNLSFNQGSDRKLIKNNMSATQYEKKIISDHQTIFHFKALTCYEALDKLQSDDTFVNTLIDILKNGTNFKGTFQT